MRTLASFVSPVHVELKDSFLTRHSVPVDPIQKTWAQIFDCSSLRQLDTFKGLDQQRDGSFIAQPFRAFESATA